MSHQVVVVRQSSERVPVLRAVTPTCEEQQVHLFECLDIKQNRERPSSALGSGPVRRQLGFNKTETFEVGAISKAQKAQSFQISKRGPFRRFENPFCCKISKTLNGALWRHFEKLSKKNTKSENFEQSHSAENLQVGILWAFLTPIHLQNIKTIEGGPLKSLKNFREKISQS